MSEKMKSEEVYVKFDKMMESLFSHVKDRNLGCIEKELLFLQEFVNTIIAQTDSDDGTLWYTQGQMTELELNTLALQFDEEFKEEVKEQDSILSQVEREQAFASELVRHSRNGNAKKHNPLLHSRLSLTEEEEIRYKLFTDRDSNYIAINTDAKVVGTLDDKGRFKKVDNPS